MHRVGAQLKIAKDLDLITDTNAAASTDSQIERMTVVGTVGAGGAGNLNVNVLTPERTSSALYNGGAGKNITVAVANNDTASQVATKIRTALDGDTDVAAVFDEAAGAGANVDMEFLVANDTVDVNISYTLGTSTGLTAVPASTVQTEGKGLGDLAVALETATMAASASETNREHTIKALLTGKALGLTMTGTIDGLITNTGVPSSYKGRSFFD